MIGIITATKEEFAELNKLLGTAATGPLNFIRGTIEGTEVVGVQAGIGKVNAALCAQQMIDRYPVSGIVNVGVAGSLNPELKVGDVVISRDAIQHDFDTCFFGDAPGFITGFPTREFAADPALAEAAGQAASELGYRFCTGRVLSGDQFICDAAKKQQLVSEFQGDCTEMEGASIAQVCTANRVPFVIIRAISDGADDGAGMSYNEFVVYAAERAMNLISGCLSRLG